MLTIGSEDISFYLVKFKRHQNSILSLELADLLVIGDDGVAPLDLRVQSIQLSPAHFLDLIRLEFPLLLLLLRFCQLTLRRQKLFVQNLSFVLRL